MQFAKAAFPESGIEARKELSRKEGRRRPEGCRWLGERSLEQPLRRSARKAGAGQITVADTLKKEIATHFTILAWKIPWTEKPGEPQSTEVQRLRHD